MVIIQFVSMIKCDSAILTRIVANLGALLVIFKGLLRDNIFVKKYLIKTNWQKFPRFGH